VPGKVIREGDTWFLVHKKEATVYAFLLEENWKFGERRNFSFKSLQAGKNAKISVLGHAGKVLEYQPEVDPSPTIESTADGMEISLMRAQRIYNDRKWPNPLVLKLEGVQFN
jgi:alpha-L-fucosidase